MDRGAIREQRESENIRNSIESPETLKVVLCPFLVGGLYFQYLAAFNIREVIKLMTSPPVAHGPKSKDALPGGQFGEFGASKEWHVLRLTPNFELYHQLMSQCSLNCIETWDRTEYACILIISYNHSLQFSSSTSEKVLNTRNFTTTFAKFYHFYLQSCYVRCPESAPFNEMAGYSSVPAGIRSWCEPRHPEVMMKWNPKILVHIIYIYPWPSIFPYKNWW